MYRSFSISRILDFEFWNALDHKKGPTIQKSIFRSDSTGFTYTKNRFSGILKTILVFYVRQLNKKVYRCLRPAWARIWGILNIQMKKMMTSKKSMQEGSEGKIIIFNCYCDLKDSYTRKNVQNSFNIKGSK